MAELLNLLKKKSRRSDSDTEVRSLEGKRACEDSTLSDSTFYDEVDEGEEAMTALGLSDNILEKLQQILSKLDNLEAKINTVEEKVTHLENTVGKTRDDISAVKQKNEDLTTTVNETGKALAFMDEQGHPTTSFGRYLFGGG